MEKLKTDFYIFDSSNLYTLTQTNTITVPHSHEFYELFYIIHGTFTHIVDGHEETLETGDIRFIPPDISHTLVTRENGLHRTFIIKKAYFERVCQLLKIENSFFTSNQLKKNWHLSFKQISTIESMVALLSEELLHTQRKRCLELNVINTILTIICDLRIKENTASAPVPACIQHLLEIINTPQFIKDSSINSIINQIGYSTTYISHLFKKVMGVSIAEYVKEKKAIHIEYYLRNTGYSLSEIRTLVGLKNLSHFNNLFKEKYGIPPSKYRKQHRKLPPSQSKNDE